ncbi:MAG: TRAP transporter small permease [Alphaproteobacteria bacterium]|nr:MAG: TRAP transporter small permease [Alphaproteobacteria bacterium]
MHDAKSGLVDRIEETLISLILGLMTLITFANVVTRYVFNLNILWALELTVFLFAWLVLLGASYAVKKSAHLGVDAVINAVGPGPRLALGAISAALCILYAFLLLKGGWDYWANFANLPQTEGRWFPLGFEEDFLPKGWYEVNDIPMPAFLRWIEPLMNEGEHYEKIPRFIPYAVLPLSMALLLFRFVQATVRLLTGRIDRLVASHEAEDEIAEIREHGGENG